MSFKVYTKGSVFHVVNNDNNVDYEAHVNDVLITKQLTTSTDYYFQGLPTFNANNMLPIADIQDESGTPYSSASFETFYQNNTGIPVSGGGDASASNQLLQLAKLDTSNVTLDTISTKQDVISDKILDSNTWLESLDSNDYATSANQVTETAKITELLALDYLQIAKGYVSGVSQIQKSGRNPNVTSASVPEDIWNGSAVYAGFPLGAPEVLRFSSSSASDTGVVTYMYLASNTSTSYQTATITLNGTTPVLGVSAWRVHSASYSNAGLTFNVGTITCQHNVTTANIFFQMPVGTNQTYVSAYTVPFGSTAFVKSVFAGVNTTTSMAVQHALWIRETTKSPRLRRNGSFSNTNNYLDHTVLLKIPALTDITLRITSTTSNTGQVIVGGFDLIQFNTVL